MYEQCPIPTMWSMHQHTWKLQAKNRLTSLKFHLISINTLNIPRTSSQLIYAQVILIYQTKVPRTSLYNICSYVNVLLWGFFFKICSHNCYIYITIQIIQINIAATNYMAMFYFLFYFSLGYTCTLCVELKC